ncbi:MAG: 30S ribosomal protein S9 [Candidatus Poribacteria bacterium]|nr:30S ribosomal protein S9 [Candidatus Poribacteria bacterium]
MAEYVWGTGRRKTSVARVRISPSGSGQFIVNGRELDAYFNRDVHSTTAQEPIKATETEGMDVFVNVKGGGQTGQAGAIRHGLSRALVKHNEALRPTLKQRGFLTRDARMVERKKPGRPGARKRFQFSKR